MVAEFELPTQIELICLHVFQSAPSSGSVLHFSSRFYSNPTSSTFRNNFDSGYNWRLRGSIHMATQI